MTEQDFKDVIRKRIAHFQSKYHAHEAGRLTIALKAIEELIPPEDWTQQQIPAGNEEQPSPSAVIQDPCIRCGKSYRLQTAFGCVDIACYRQYLPKRDDTFGDYHMLT